MGFRHATVRYGFGAFELESDPGLGSSGELWFPEKPGAARTADQSAPHYGVGDLQQKTRTRKLADHPRLGTGREPAGCDHQRISTGICDPVVSAHAICTR